MSKFHYFDQKEADDDDFILEGSIDQGYVPKTCLLGGITVMSEVRDGRDPCVGCVGPRDKCYGRKRGPND